MSVVDSEKPAAINGKRLAELCANDWGIYNAFTMVLENTATMADKFDLTAKDKEVVKEKLAVVSRLIENEPKTINWKMRARVGEKVHWYKLAEDRAD